MHSKAVVSTTQVELTAYDLLSNFQRSKSSNRSVGLSELEEQISMLFEWSFKTVIRTPRGELPQVALGRHLAKTAQECRTVPSAYASLCASPKGEAELITTEVVRPSVEIQIFGPEAPTERPQLPKKTEKSPISPSSDSSDGLAKTLLPPTPITLARSQPVSPLGTRAISPSTMPELSPLRQLDSSALRGPSPVRLSSHNLKPRSNLFRDSARTLLKPNPFSEASGRVMRQSAERRGIRSQSQNKGHTRPLALNGMAAIAGVYGSIRAPSKARLGARE